MRANLIYNPNALGSGVVSPDVMAQALIQAGYEPVYEATTCEEDLDSILTRNVEGLVVVAGGDGSVRAVVRRMLGKSNPIAILPMGTSNNIARSLGIDGDLLRDIAGLNNPRPFAFDLGCMDLPCGTEYFLEALGFGIFADGLSAYEPDKGKSVIRSLAATVQTLSNFQASHCEMRLDGQDISGMYWMVEVMNTSSFGPWIKAAPQADPGDGFLDVVCVREENRESLLAYISALLSERLEQLPSVDVFRGKKLEILWNGFNIHSDVEVYPKVKEGHQEQVLEIGLQPGAINLWLPGTEKGA